MAIKNKKKDDVLEEYCLLTEVLEEIEWALEGECNDIDCDKYIFRDILKKKFKPILEHGFSCLSKLRTDKKALMRLLSLSKFKPFRYGKCSVCKKSVDKLSKKSIIVSFTRPTSKGAVEWKGYWAHNICKKKVKTPKGWKKGF